MGLNIYKLKEKEKKENAADYLRIKLLKNKTSNLVNTWVVNDAMGTSEAIVSAFGSDLLRF